MSIDPLLINSALLSVVIFLLGFIGAYLKKVLEKLIDEVELSNKRHDVTDVVVSAILKDSFNSKGIAEDTLEWPRIFNSRKPRDN